MLANHQRISLAVLTALAVALASSDVWARGGGRAGGGGAGRSYGGGDRGGYGAGDRSGYNSGDRGVNGGDRGVNGGFNAAANHPNNFNANANSGFATRHFSTNNWNGANANRLGADANANRLGADANAWRADGAIGPYGAGYGGLGYGALGAAAGYGAGYPLFGMYGTGGYGYGGGAYSNAGYNTSGGNYASDDTTYSSTPATIQNNTVPTDDQVTSAAQFDAKGEADFKAGNYQAAVQDWQHVLIDTPHNGGDMLLLAQGLFAIGQYQPAAGAVQLGMQMLPQDEWGTVIKHHTDLYPSNNAFTEQLRALETARTANPNDPALRFLLGYQYGYLGYPTQAIKELDKGIALRPQDRGAVVMRNLFAAQANVPALPLPPLPTPSAKTGTPATTPVSTTNPAS